MTQSIVATLIVLAAAAWLLRRLYLTLRAALRGGTGPGASCGSCSRNPTNTSPPMIQLGSSRSNSANRGRHA
jgi:hypothetical protein